MAGMKVNAIGDEVREACCENPHLVISGGEVVCMNCSMVVDRVMLGAERRMYTRDEVLDIKHNENDPTGGVGARTVISRGMTDYQGRLLSPTSRRRFQKLNRIQHFLNGQERNLHKAHFEARRLCYNLKVPPQIKATAWKIYKKSLEKNLLRGRSIEAFVAASIYAAIRVHEFPRILDEVCSSLSVERRRVVNALKVMYSEVFPELGLKYRPLGPRELIFYFGDKLSLSMEVKMKALQLYQEAARGGLRSAGKDPRGLASAALYLAAAHIPELALRQKDICEVTGITETTLRNQSRNIGDVMNAIRVAREDAEADISAPTAEEPREADEEIQFPTPEEPSDIEKIVKRLGA